MVLFEQEKEVLDKLLDAWYKAVKQFTDEANGIFSEKGRMYDRIAPVWKRCKWPHGFIHEITKKGDRVEQLCQTFDPDDPRGSVDWEEVREELLDIMNYCRMFGGLTDMVLKEEGND